MKFYLERLRVFWIAVALVRCASTAPCDADHECSQRVKRNTYLMNVLNNMLVQHFSVAPGPEFLDFFNYDYSAEDEWSRRDYKRPIVDDRYPVDYEDMPLSVSNRNHGGIDYCCPEEVTEIVPIVEVKDEAPVKEETYDYYESDCSDYSDEEDDSNWVDVRPIDSEPEIEEPASKNDKLPQDPFQNNLNRQFVQSFPFGRDPKFTVHECFPGLASSPPSAGTGQKGNDKEDSSEGEYVVLFIRRDQLIGVTKKENKTETSTTSGLPVDTTTTEPCTTEIVQTTASPEEEGGETTFTMATSSSSTTTSSTTFDDTESPCSTTSSDTVGGTAFPISSTITAGPPFITSSTTEGEETSPCSDESPAEGTTEATEATKVTEVSESTEASKATGSSGDTVATEATEATEAIDASQDTMASEVTEVTEATATSECTEDSETSESEIEDMDNDPTTPGPSESQTTEDVTDEPPIIDTTAVA